MIARVREAHTRYSSSPRVPRSSPLFHLVEEVVVPPLLVALPPLVVQQRRLLRRRLRKRRRRSPTRTWASVCSTKRVTSGCGQREIIPGH